MRRFMRLGGFEKETWGRNWTEILVIARTWGGAVIQNGSTTTLQSLTEIMRKVHVSLRGSAFCPYSRLITKSKWRTDGSLLPAASSASEQDPNEVTASCMQILIHAAVPSSPTQTPTPPPGLDLLPGLSPFSHALRQTCDLALRRVSRDTRKTMGRSVSPELWRPYRRQEPGQTVGTWRIQGVARPPHHREPTGDVSVRLAVAHVYSITVLLELSLGSLSPQHSSGSYHMFSSLLQQHCPYQTLPSILTRNT